MRNIPIPVDVSKLEFVCVAAPRPRVMNKQTGEVKVDKQGRTVFTVGLSVSDLGSDGLELVNVNISADPPVTVGMVVTPVDLVGFVWEQTRNGETRWGISYRATDLVPASSAPSADQAA